MLGHQLGQNFILGLDLLLQPLDPFLFGLAMAAVLSLEGSGSILKEFFLPAVEHRRLQRQLVAELRDRLLVHEMPPQDGDLLFGCVLLSCFFHAFPPLA